MSQSYASSITASPIPAVEVQADEKFNNDEKTVSDIEQSPVPSIYSSPRGWSKFLLVAVLTGAQFFDIFTACSAMAALPTLGEKLGFTAGQLPWVLSAYTLTFGAFQVPAGRLSDIYSPKPVFCIGFFAVGIFSILCAVSVDPIMLLVFRAVSGLCAAMTVPSSISVLVQTFPDPKEKADVLGIFGASGAVGNCVGLIVGGILSSQVSWRWIYYIIAICVIPFSIASIWVLPSNTLPKSETKRSLDLPGIAVLTAALILFVYAISDANTEGWDSPQIIATLVLSIVLFVVFFVVERYVSDPALPPKTWRNKNFAVMFVYSWSVYWFFFVIEASWVQIFQDLWHWSALKASVHCLPIGITGGVAVYLSGAYGHLVPRRVLLLAGQLLMLVGSVLFALADEPHRYWSYVVPGMIVGMFGLAMAYLGSNFTTMAGAPKGEEGVVGAVLYTSYQIGSTVGIAVAAAVTQGVNSRQGMDSVAQFKGYAASFWSLVALHGLMSVITILFVQD